MLGAPGALAGQFWFAVAEAGVRWNVVLAILNLFPILPLDGGRIVTSLLPGPLSYQYSRLEPLRHDDPHPADRDRRAGRVLLPLMNVTIEQHLLDLGLQ